MRGQKVFVAACFVGAGVLGSVATAGAVPSSTNCAQTLKLVTTGQLDGGWDSQKDSWKLGDAISDGFFDNEPSVIHEEIQEWEELGPEEVSSYYKAGNVSGAPNPGPETGDGFVTWGSVRRDANGGSCT